MLGAHGLLLARPERLGLEVLRHVLRRHLVEQRRERVVEHSLVGRVGGEVRTAEVAGRQDVARDERVIMARCSSCCKGSDEGEDRESCKHLRHKVSTLSPWTSSCLSLPPSCRCGSPG